MALIGTRRALYGNIFSIAKLFGNGAYNGFYYDFGQVNTLYQTTDTSTPVTTAGQTIGRVNDLSPNASASTQSVSGMRPAWQTTYANCDGADDHVLSGFTASTTAMTVGACVRGSTGQRVVMGGYATSLDRGLTVGLSSSGFLAAVCGDQSVEGSIAGSVDVRNTDIVAMARMTGTFVELWMNGVLIDSGTVGGTPTTIIPYAISGRWTGAAIANPWSGRIYRAFAVKTAIPNNYIIPASRALGLGVVNI